MEITEVRVKLHNRSPDRLKAYCTITFDEVFVVRDVKIVEGTNGLFVAMPSRKLAVPCPKCRYNNPLRARFCSGCGARLSPSDLPPDPSGRARLHRDIAHPITGSFREYLQARVVEAYEAEGEQAEEPGYAPAPLDVDADTEDARGDDAAPGARSGFEAAPAETGVGESGAHPEPVCGEVPTDHVDPGAAEEEPPEPDEPDDACNGSTPFGAGIL